MMSKILSAASGTVHQTEAGTSFTHLISSHTAYIVYLSISLSPFVLLLPALLLLLNDLHDL